MEALNHKLRRLSFALPFLRIGMGLQPPTSTGGIGMSNKLYDVLKYIQQIVLPALGTLYAALSGIWGFPFGEQIVGTIVAVDAFLGALLKISSNAYYKEKADE